MVDTHRIFLGLGANLGNRKSNFIKAFQQIGHFATIEAISSFYVTKPVGYLEQPDFLNCACQVSSQLAAIELLHALKQIERQMGRISSFRNAPRPIDIDLLFYDDWVLETDELVLPHPRLAERAFVLVPMVEIAPELTHPILGASMVDLLERVDRTGVYQWEHDSKDRFVACRETQTIEPFPEYPSLSERLKD